MAEAAPERITDLLKDDDYLYDEDDPAADMDADKPETPRGPPSKQQQQPSQQQQDTPAAGKQRVPIPAPAKQLRAGSTAEEGLPERQLGNGSVAREEQGSGVSRLPPPEASRYFIIKSNSEYNIKLSVQTGVWSTKVRRPCRSLLCPLNPPRPCAAWQPGCFCCARTCRSGSQGCMRSSRLLQGAWLDLQLQQPLAAFAAPCPASDCALSNPHAGLLAASRVGQFPHGCASAPDWSHAVGCAPPAELHLCALSASCWTEGL